MQPTPTPVLSQAAKVFHAAIKDAEVLLNYFDEHNTKPPPPETEVLKRASLIMALTAWETYVEDRLAEGFELHLKALSGSSFAALLRTKIQEDIKRLHTPGFAKTQKLFTDYLGVDITADWHWPNKDAAAVKKQLETLIGKRGQAAHRSPASNSTDQGGHLIKREELEKGIRFLRSLVEKTEQSLTKAVD